MTHGFGHDDDDLAAVARRLQVDDHCVDWVARLLALAAIFIGLWRI